MTDHLIQDLLLVVQLGTILTDDSQLPPELLASIELLESLVNGGPVG